MWTRTLSIFGMVGLLTACEDMAQDTGDPGSAAVEKKATKTSNPLALTARAESTRLWLSWNQTSENIFNMSAYRVSDHAMMPVEIQVQGADKQAVLTGLAPSTSYCIHLEKVSNSGGISKKSDLCTSTVASSVDATSSTLAVSLDAPATMSQADSIVYGEIYAEASDSADKVLQLDIFVDGLLNSTTGAWNDSMLGLNQFYLTSDAYAPGGWYGGYWGYWAYPHTLGTHTMQAVAYTIGGKVGRSDAVSFEIVP